MGMGEGPRPRTQDQGGQRPLLAVPALAIRLRIWDIYWLWTDCSKPSEKSHLHLSVSGSGRCPSLNQTAPDMPLAGCGEKGRVVHGCHVTHLDTIR